MHEIGAGEHVGSVNSTNTFSARTIGGRILGLDGVRGLAILIVATHNIGSFEQPADSLAIKLLRVFFGAGWVGVTLFFVLSGFLITGILLDTKGDAHYFRTFFTRRILRIFPLYFLTLAAALLLLPRIIDLGEWGERAQTIQVWYWTFLMNWTDPFVGTLPGLSHFWSLAVEEQFYLLWPLVVFIVPSRTLMRVCAVLIAVTLVTRIAMVASSAPVLVVYNFTITRWDALAWGAVLAVAVRERAHYAFLLPWLRRSLIPLAVALLAIVIADRGLLWFSPLSQTVGYSVVAMLCASLILVVVEPGSSMAWFNRATESSLLRFFGKYSYGMYVLHWPIHRLGQFLATDWVVGSGGWARPIHLLTYVAVVFALSTVAAVIVWHLVEQPFLALKDRLAARRDESGRQAVVVA